MLTRTVGLVAAAVLTLGLAACGEDSDDVGTDPGTSETTSDTTTAPTSDATPDSTESTDGATATTETDAPAGDTVACTYAPDDLSGAATPPPADAPATGTRAVTLDTTIGEIDLSLDASEAPCTVNSFISLVEQGFYDGTTCHRLTTAGIFVLQCGDPGNGPFGPGTGGPGYTVQDEFPPASAYGPGTLAMAKTQEPDSGGSQFFIVYDGPETQLTPDYTIFGEVTKGLDLVQEAAAAGTQADGTTPATTVTIDAATAS